MRLALLIVLCACATAHSSLEERVLSASVQGWSAAGLKQPVEGCYDGFAIRWAPDAAEFAASCTGSTVEHTASCLSQVDLLGAGHARADYEYTAVLRPGQAIDSGGDPAVHEAMHLLYFCAGYGSAQDPWDYQHQHHSVWAKWGAQTAQARARAAFGGQ